MGAAAQLILPGSEKFQSSLRSIGQPSSTSTAKCLRTQGFSNESATQVARSLANSTLPSIAINRQNDGIDPRQIGDCKFFTGFHLDNVSGIEKLHDFDREDATTLHAYSTARLKPFIPTKGAFIYAFDDSKIQTDKGTYTLKAGMYAAIDGQVKIAGRGIIVENHRYAPIFQLGGPLEDDGRLKYIDGCTSTELIKPQKLGDPCLNHLHFPNSIDQTMHTHPSVRVGMIAKGNGTCVVPGREVPLTPGTIFIIHKEEDRYEKVGGRLAQEGSHKFRTEDEGMDVIAYHPDSTTGPTDESHQMLNNTIVNGTSANQLKEIRTQ